MNPEAMDEMGAESLLDMPLRVWAEIGRTRLPAAYVVGMPQGAIIDLDCEPDEPAELFVNGRLFGTGKLVLVDGEWAIRVESLVEDDLDEDVEAEAEEADVEQASGDVQDSVEAAD